MRIITNNKITRAVSWSYKNRGKFAFLAAAGIFGTMAYNNTKPIDACEAAKLDLKNANRIVVSTGTDKDYKEGRIGTASAFIASNCPGP